MSDPTGPGPALPGVEEVVARLERVRARIRSAGGSSETVEVLAVTKGFGAGALTLARHAGLSLVGENYAQELRAKADQLDRSDLEGLRIHFIGQLQSNKVSGIADLVSCWQTVDRAKIAGEIARRAPGSEVMIQVAISDEPNKGGVSPDQLDDLVDVVLSSGLRLVGLMGVASRAGPEVVAREFSVLRRLVDANGLDHCSMGMTDDLEVAVGEGSTMVRVGRALFGPRPRPAAMKH